MKNIIFQKHPDSSILFDTLGGCDIVAMIDDDGKKYFFPQIGENEFMAITFDTDSAPNRKDQFVGALKEMIDFYRRKGIAEIYLFSTNNELLNWLSTHTI